MTCATPRTTSSASMGRRPKRVPALGGERPSATDTACGAMIALGMGLALAGRPTTESVRPVDNIQGGDAAELAGVGRYQRCIDASGLRRDQHVERTDR